MYNIFLCVAWPLIVFLTIMAYRIAKKKFNHNIAVIIAGITGFIAALISGNAIGYWYSLGHFEIKDILRNLSYIFSLWLAS
jgi:xanthine/uracil permease